MSCIDHGLTWNEGSRLSDGRIFTGKCTESLILSYLRRRRCIGSAFLEKCNFSFFWFGSKFTQTFNTPARHTTTTNSCEYHREEAKPLGSSIFRAMQWSSLGRTCVCVVAVRWNVIWYSSCLFLLQTSLFSSLRMRFLLFSISLLHIHISRLPVFLTVLISCCIFGRPSKRTLMKLPVSHLLSVAKPESALSLWVNIHSSSSLPTVVVDWVNFPQTDFSVCRMNLEVDSNHCLRTQLVFCWPRWASTQHSVIGQYSSGKNVRKTLFRKRQKSMLQVSIWFEPKIYSTLILRRGTASRNCYWFYSERIAQNFNDDVWNRKQRLGSENTAGAAETIKDPLLGAVLIKMG